MSNHPTNNSTSEEIDLGYLIKQTVFLFKRAIKYLFIVINFFLKFKFILLGIIIIGILYGYNKDKNSLKTYESQVLVIPNFESVDYMYDKSEALNTKVRLKDTVFLKDLFGSKSIYFRNLEIEPIVDIYNFVSKSRENIDVFRILSHNQDMKDYVEDMSNSKYYKYHRMTFTIVGKDNAEFIVDRVLNYLNDNSHFNEYREVSIENTQMLLDENIKMITQVDSIISASTAFAANNKSNQSVFINNNSQLNSLLTTKQELLDNRLKILFKAKDETAIVKIVSASYNLIGEKRFIISNKIKYPVLFVFAFSMFFFVRFLFKKLKAIAETA